MASSPSWGHCRRGRIAAVVAVAAMVAGACSGAPSPDDGTVAVGDGDGSTLPDAGDRRGRPGAPGERSTRSTDPTAAGSEAGGGADGGGGGAGASTGGTAVGGGGGTSGGGGGGAGAPHRSTLFTADEDRIGITDTEIRLCGHAALTYGQAFNTTADDLNVYWTAVNEELDGVHGRHVEMSWENDNYSPDTAVQAATACQQKGIFMLLGGIGFDQIPAVRNWAEQNRMPYFHHTATVNGSEGKKFSYTPLPTTEKMGAMFAESIAATSPGARIAIIKRASENWEPGIDGFHEVAEQHGLNVVFQRPVQANKRTYTQDVIDARNSTADLVFVWLNALESTEFISQSKQQNWHPQFWVFPFNLTTQTLAEINRSYALNPPIMGVAMFNAYSEGDYSGEFAKYADDIQQFEAQYAKYRPNVDLGGVGGDLLFLNWTAQKATHQLLVQCGADCSRNRFFSLLHGYKARTSSSACVVDFTRPGPDNDHRGGWAVSVMKAYEAPDGNVNFRNTHTCVEHVV